MKIAMVVGEKLGHPAGLRFFQDADAAVNAGEDPAKLIVLGGFLCKWPEAAGAVPKANDIAAWEAEYDAKPKVTPGMQAYELIKQDATAFAALKADLQ